MSRVPTGTGFFSILSMSAAKRCARGTPRRLMPTMASCSAPLLRSTISCANRTRVRSISEPDMMRAFSRKRTACFCAVSLIKKRNDPQHHNRSQVRGRLRRCDPAIAPPTLPKPTNSTKRNTSITTNTMASASGLFASRL